MKNGLIIYIFIFFIFSPIKNRLINQKISVAYGLDNKYTYPTLVSMISILENAFEALIGAIFLDSDFNQTKKLVYDLLKENIHLALSGHLNNDYKTALQELIQQQRDHVIEYVLDRTTGPEHEKIFYVSLFINGEKCGEGMGKTKKEAEQQAAKNVLHEKLN